MTNRRVVGVAIFALVAALQLSAADFDVKTFGAKGDGKTPDRDAINKAIEAAGAAGGGTVIIPAGTYVTGSIRLRSNLTLRFEPGSAFLMLVRPRVIGVEQQVRIDEDHWCSAPSTCSMSSATLSRESPGLRSPRSRAVILKGCRRAVARRLASPQRSVSLTISRKGRPARRDSALSLAATSSSRVSVVRMS